MPDAGRDPSRTRTGKKSPDDASGEESKLLTRRLTADTILSRITTLPVPSETIRRPLCTKNPETADPLERDRFFDVFLPVAPATDPAVALCAAHLDRYRAAGLALARFADVTLGQSTVVGHLPLNRADFWRHALTVACISEMIDDRCGGRCLGVRLFVASLLHDVGKLVLDHLVPKAYHRVRRLSETRRLKLDRVERAHLGVDHSRVGRTLAAHWNLPRAVQDVIALHHQPSDVIQAIAPRSTELIITVQLADALAPRAPEGHPARAGAETIASLWAGLGISAAQRETFETPESGGIAARVAARVEQLQRLLAIVSLPPAADPSAQAHLRVGTRQVGHEPGRPAPRRAVDRESLASRCVQTAARFASTCSTGRRATEICGVVADCFCEAFDIDEAIAFHADATGTVFDCGAYRRGRITTRMLVIEPSDAATADGLDAYGPADPGCSFMPAPSPTDPVRQHFRRLFCNDLEHLFPIAAGGIVVGGVLFDADAAQLRALTDAPDAVEMLGALFGAALAQSRRLAPGDRLCNFLAETAPHLEEPPGETARRRAIGMVAEMAAGAAHELNTPLAVISGRAQVLAGRASKKDRNALEAIREQCDRCSRIVNALITFAKPRPPQAVIVALGRWLRRLRNRWLEHRALAGGSFEITLADPSISVRVDPDQLEQVFAALMANALQAMPVQKARLIINSPSNSSDETVVIAVADNGCGMAADVLERACDPFFSHRRAGRGRGLGLSTAQRLVENNGGRLWLESAPGCGTTVFVELRAASTL